MEPSNNGGTRSFWCILESDPAGCGDPINNCEYGYYTLGCGEGQTNPPECLSEGSDYYVECRQGPCSCISVCGDGLCASDESGCSLDCQSPSLPTTAITSPSSGSWQTANFVVSFDDNNADTCEFRVLSNGVQTRGWSTRVCDSTATISVGGGQNCRNQGTNTCVVESRATNSDGTDTDSRAFSIDWTSPSTSITSPSAGSQHISDFSVSFSDSDSASGLSYCRYRVKSNGIQTVPSSGSWATRSCNSQVTVTVGTTGNCRHEGSNKCLVETRAVDNAGNSNTGSRFFSITLISPPPGCGDGVLDTGESCDEGSDNGVCGDTGVTCEQITCKLCEHIAATDSTYKPCWNDVDDDGDGKYDFTGQPPAGGTPEGADCAFPFSSISAPSSADVGSTYQASCTSSYGWQQRLGVNVVSGGGGSVYRGYTATEGYRADITASTSCGTQTLQCGSDKAGVAIAAPIRQTTVSIVASEPGTETSCSDGIDNDCDNYIDGDDSDCPDLCGPGTSRDLYSSWGNWYGTPALFQTDASTDCCNINTQCPFDDSCRSLGYKNADSDAICGRVGTKRAAVYDCKLSLYEGDIFTGNSGGIQYCCVDDGDGDDEGIFTTDLSQCSTTPPASTYILSPGAGSWQNSSFTVQFDDFNANTCYYRVFSNSVKTFPASGSWATRTCDGTKTISIGSGNNCRNQGTNKCVVESQATGDGGSGTASRSFSIDWSQPSLTVEGPTGRIRTSDTITITATSSDSRSGIYDTRIFLDGSAVRTCTSAGACTYSRSPMPAGSSHTYYAIARDVAGNARTSSSQSFVINTKPTLVSISNTGDTSENGIATIQCVTTDPDQADNTLDTRLWAGECNTANCYNTRAWATADPNDIVYYKNGVMDSPASGNIFTKSFTITQAENTGLAAACRSIDDLGEKSNWKDAYPLFVVGPLCDNPPDFSNIVSTPDLLKTVTIMITFTSDQALIADPTVTLHNKDTGSDLRIASLVSQSGNDYTYSADVLVGDLTGSYDVKIEGDNGECTATDFGGDFDIDQIPPSTSILCNSGSCSGTFDDDVNVELICTDSGSAGCKEIQYRIDGDTWQVVGGATASFLVQGQGTHEIEFFSTDNVDNQEAVMLQTIDLDIPASSIEANIVLDNTNVQQGELINVRFFGKINRDGDTDPCTQSECTPTNFSVNGDNLLSELVWNGNEWTYVINTYQYGSTVEGCIRHDDSGFEDCKTVTYTVSESVIDINIRFPDVDKGLVPLTATGLPNFTRPMPLAFVAEAQFSNSITEKCSSNNCEARYRIDGSGDWIGEDLANFDAFEDGFVANPSSGSYDCDTTHLLEINVTKTTAPGAGVNTVSSKEIFLSCVPRVIVDPIERRLAVGSRNIQAFVVTVVNPKDAATYNLEMQSANPEGYPLQWINFNYRGEDKGDAFDLYINDISMDEVLVDMPEASRAGIYPVNFVATSSTGIYTETGTILIFSESLPDFSPVYLIPLALIAMLLVYSDTFGVIGIRKRK